MENKIAIIETIKETQVQKTLQAISSFQAIVKSQFKDKHHYGIIPGTGKKPTLLKPGAEVIVTLLGLSTEFNIISCARDFEGEFFDYVIKCTLKSSREVLFTQLSTISVAFPSFLLIQVFLWYHLPLVLKLY